MDDGTLWGALGLGQLDGSGALGQCHEQMVAAQQSSYGGFSPHLQGYHCSQGFMSQQEHQLARAGQLNDGMWGLLGGGHQQAALAEIRAAQLSGFARGLQSGYSPPSVPEPSRPPRPGRLRRNWEAACEIWSSVEWYRS